MKTPQNSALNFTSFINVGDMILLLLFLKPVGNNPCFYCTASKIITTHFMAGSVRPPFSWYQFFLIVTSKHKYVFNDTVS